MTQRQIKFRQVSGDTSWQAQGRCRGTSVDMFPDDYDGVVKAKRVCEGCPVQEPCLEYALANREDDGVWGGMGKRERRRILKARRGVA